MEKVSIIIPNYNGGRFLVQCLNSVIKQNYDNKEIIIVDDGSTDESRKIIEKYIDEHSEHNIIAIFQANMNASIARNEGIKVASGKYVVFLDSDDILEDNIIKFCVESMKKNNSDLVIGNYTIINEDNEIVENNKDIIGGKEYKSNNIFSELFDVNPVPSNKLYDLELIKKMVLFFGNLRIGQDLNFYLKYLLICKKISTIVRSVYKYRIVSNSMSRMKSFRIFDIVESFNDVKNFYKINKSLEVYQNYIQVLELRHYHRQMEKQISFKKRDERKVIVTYFKIQEKRLDYKIMKNFNNYYKNIYFRFKVKTKLSFLYYSKMYSIIKKVVKK